MALSRYSGYFTLWDGATVSYSDNVGVVDSFDYDIIRAPKDDYSPYFKVRIAANADYSPYFTVNIHHEDSHFDKIGVIDTFDSDWRDATFTESWKDNVGIVDVFDSAWRPGIHVSGDDDVVIVDSFDYYVSQHHSESWKDNVGVVDFFGATLVSWEFSNKDEVIITDTIDWSQFIPASRYKDEVVITDSFATPRIDRARTFDDDITIRDFSDIVILDPNAQGMQFMSITNPTRVRFERGREIEIREPFGQRQIVGFSNTLQSKIQDYGSDEKYFEIIVSKIAEDLYDDLQAFFAHSSTKYTNESFMFIKEDHTTFEKVRLWKAMNFDLPHVKGGLYDVKLLLKGEV